MSYVKSNLDHKTFCLILGLLVSSLFLTAQDRHFSQYHASPLQLNPALSGLINGSYRVNINYRNQWNQIEGQHFTTSAASGDMNIKGPFKSAQQDLVGLGISFYSDKSSGFNFNTIEVAFNGAYHKSLGLNQYLSAGIKWGLLQRGVNYENLSFEDQYVEGSGYALNSGEVLPENNVSGMELGLGINYTWTSRDQAGINVGFSMGHITQPDFSYFNLSPPPNTTPIKHALFRTYNFHASGSVPVIESYTILPRVWIVNQGPHLQANLGSLIRLPLNNDNSNAFNFGGFMRIVKNQKSMSLESLIPQLGLELGNLNIGLSYDANLRRFAPSYFQQSVFELSISLIGQQDNDGFFCPKF